MKRWLFSCAAALLALQVPSCNFSGNVEQLLTPPRLNAEQEKIYQALQNAAGAAVSLKYPRSGDRLSAFLVEDFDGDEIDEALVFYEISRTAPGENNLRICLLNQDDGNWRAIQDYAAFNGELESVEVKALGSNPRSNLIIRYNMSESSDHLAEIFHYEEGELKRTLSLSYSAMEVRDLDQDGTQELFAVTAAKPSLPASASVYALDESGNYVQTSIPLPDSFGEIANVTYGVMPTTSLSHGIPAVYIDGITGTATAQTAILSYQNSALTTLYADSEDRFPNTIRPRECRTTDLNGDGEPEIPVQTIFYGYSAEAESPPPSLTNWYVCRNGLLMREFASYYAVQEGYVFRIPERWEHNVTAVQEDTEIVFYAFDSTAQNADGTPKTGEPLLRLTVVTDTIAADILQQDGYLLLRQINDNRYLGKPESSGGSLSLSAGELLTSMRFPGS